MALDTNAQTAIDLSEARYRVSFDLQTFRDYLFGDCSNLERFPWMTFKLTGDAFDIAGRRNWESFERIESFLRNDPVFDKTSR